MDDDERAAFAGVLPEPEAREWEPLRTNLSLGDPSPRHWLVFISAVLFLLAVISSLAMCCNG